MKRAATQTMIYATALAASVWTALASSASRAADLSPQYKAPAAYTSPQPVFSWTGLYAGFNAGYGTSGDNAYNNLVGVSGGKVHGALGGAQVGYNYQLSPLFVVGFENDLEATGFSNHDAVDGAAVKMPWLTTGRARAGVALLDSRLMLYGTAGLAAGELKDGTVNKIKSGWTAGGGAEYALSPKWSAKLEYLYVDLKHDNLPDWNAAKFHTVRAGVNYHFDLFR